MRDRLLSVQPIADEYRTSLAADLAEARLVRFAMAYVSEEGLKALGLERLERALIHPDSFGIATLSCACGSSPLSRLQERLGDENVRLKYFVDPQIGGRDLAEPSLELLHDKMVYLVRGDRAIIYMGSHNWSARALGPGEPRNAEGSLRLEFEFEERHLMGVGGDLPAQINQHLNYLWNLSICRAATAGHRELFEQWSELCCGRAKDPSERQSYAVVSAVCKPSPDKKHRSPEFWRSTLEDSRGIYFQLHEEDEGQILRQHQDRVLILVWVSEVELRLSRAPVLVFCKSTRSSAGPDSELQGQSGGDITDFRWLMWDEVQHQNVMAGRPPGTGQAAPVRTNRPFRYFDLNLSPSANRASLIDQGATPKYQYFLQVEDVFVPDWLTAGEEEVSGRGPGTPVEPGQESSQRQVLPWLPGDLAFSKKKTVTKRKLPGYRVAEEVCRTIMADLECDFLVDKKKLQKAKALPFSHETGGLEGKRVSSHPLHEALLDEDAIRDPRKFYARREIGAVIPNVDPTENDPASPIIARVQQVFADSPESIRRRILNQEKAD